VIWSNEISYDGYLMPLDSTYFCSTDENNVSRKR
jgi:hypothetical protein